MGGGKVTTKLPPLSLKWKYITGTTFIVLLVISIFSWQNLKLQEKQIAEDDRERVRLITEIIKNGLITIMIEGRGREFQKFLETMIAQDIEGVRIFKPDGKIVSSSKRSEIGGRINHDDIDRFIRQTSPDVFSHVRERQVVYSMVVPIYNDPICQKCHDKKEKIRGILDVEVSMDKTLTRISGLRFRSVFFSVLTLISLSLSLSLLTKYLINKPITGIMNTMKKAEEGDLNARFITVRKDEIGELSGRLNSMLFQLDNAQKEIEHFHMEEFQRIEKMASIGELAAAIAHEIKNPLAGISGAIQVFAEDFPLNDPRKEVISDVIKEIERLDKSVRDLLNFARPPVPYPLFTDIKSMMERLLNVISQQAQNQNIRINIDLDDNAGSVYLDPEQFQQVFLNIAINAIHSMPRGGQLNITARRKNTDFEFIFSDSGLGIIEKDMRNLFRPFFTTKNTGTGLGLAISKSIIEQHGGKIEVESRLGDGSTFRIIIPAMGPDNERI